MKVLIACEFSEIVKEQFLLRGHDAHSCDLLPGEKHLPNHHQCDVRTLLNEDWDMMIAHPPCTYLAVSGARYWESRQRQQAEALAFVSLLLNAPIEKIALENPVGKISTAIRKPDQYIQPYQFGHRLSKKTGLWLKGLPLLEPTEIVEPEWVYYNGGRCSPEHYANMYGKSRSKERSRTFTGIAVAMAEQWGKTP